MQTNKFTMILSVTMTPVVGLGAFKIYELDLNVFKEKF